MVFMWNHQHIGRSYISQLCTLHAFKMVDMEGSRSCLTGTALIKCCQFVYARYQECICRDEIGKKEVKYSKRNISIKSRKNSNRDSDGNSGGS